MDRDRFRKRVHDLNGEAHLLKGLMAMPERATAKDFRVVADLLTGAAADIDELVKATPPGCVCRRVQDNNYDYLDYAEGCRHHRQLHTLRERLKADYAKMEKVLKNEMRLKFVAAVLTNAAGDRHLNDNVIVTRAIRIADETILQLTEEEEDA